MSWINDDVLAYINMYENDIKRLDHLSIFYDNLFKMFQVDLQQQIKYQFIYLKQAGLQPSEILNVGGGSGDYIAIYNYNIASKIKF